MTPRILTPDDYPAIRTLGGPLAEILDDPVKTATLSDCILLGVEDPQGQLVAYWMVWQAYHLEPLYIQEAARHHARTGLALIEGMRELIAQLGVQVAFAVIGDADLETHIRQAAGLGFRKVPGEMFVLEVTDGSSGDPHLGGGGGRSRGADRQQIAQPGPAEPPANPGA